MIHLKFPNWPACRFLNWRVTAPLALGLILPACRVLPSHLHNAEDEKKILEAKTAIAAHNEAAPGLYTAMRSNLELFAKEENRVLSEYADVAAQGAYAYDDKAVPNKVLKRLVGDGAANKGEIHTFIDETIPKKVDEMNGLTAQLKAEIKAAKGPADLLKAAIKAKKDEVNAYNSSVALLRTAIAEMPGLKTSFASASVEEDPIKALEDLASSVDDLGSKKVKYVDADGKEQEKEALEVAKASYKWFRGDSGKGVALRPLPDAPGIDLIILNVSLSLLELRQAQAQADLDHLQRVKSVLAEAWNNALLARELAVDAQQVLQDANNALGEKPSYSSFTEQKVRLIQNQLGEDKMIDSHHRDMRAFLVGLRRLSLAENHFYRSQALMEVAVARLEHDRSIVQSSLNDPARLSVISRAVEGLHVYHSGGFKAEHAAQILRIAQVVALGSIAESL